MLLCPAPSAGALSDDAVWRLPVAYIGPKSRTERPRKTKIGAEVTEVTRDSDTTFKVKRSKSQGAPRACLYCYLFTDEIIYCVKGGQHWWALDFSDSLPLYLLY